MRLLTVTVPRIPVKRRINVRKEVQGASAAAVGRKREGEIQRPAVVLCWAAAAEARGRRKTRVIMLRVICALSMGWKIKCFIVFVPLLLCQLVVFVRIQKSIFSDRPWRLSLAAYTGTEGAEKCTLEQEQAESQLPEFWKSGAGRRAHCLCFTISPPGLPQQPPPCPSGFFCFRRTASPEVLSDCADLDGVESRERGSWLGTSNVTLS